MELEHSKIIVHFQLVRVGCETHIKGGGGEYSERIQNNIITQRREQVSRENKIFVTQLCNENEERKSQTNKDEIRKEKQRERRQ